MPDLPTRFGGADRIAAPDLWPEIESREPPRQSDSRPSQRVVAAAVALAIAGGGIFFAVRAFRPGQEPRPQTSMRSGSIAFAHLNGPSWDLFSTRPDGTGTIRLTGISADEFDPAWSPDGSKIAFVGQRGKMADIYVMNEIGRAHV